MAYLISTAAKTHNMLFTFKSNSAFKCRFPVFHSVFNWKECVTWYLTHRGIWRNVSLNILHIEIYGGHRLQPKPIEDTFELWSLYSVSWSSTKIHNFPFWESPAVFTVRSGGQFDKVRSSKLSIFELVYGAARIGSQHQTSQHWTKYRSQYWKPKRCNHSPASYKCLF